MSKFDFNKVILGGKLVTDVYMMQTMGGLPICDFSIAVNRKGQDGTPKTDIIRCTARKKTAELIYKNFTKGSSICIVGQLDTQQTFEDSFGIVRYLCEVVVDEVVPVDDKITRKAHK